MDPAAVFTQLFSVATGFNEVAPRYQGQLAAEGTSSVTTTAGVRNLLYAADERTPVYWKGHCGIVLLVFAPLGFGLILLGLPTVALLTVGIMLWLAMLPDVDHRLPLIEHRGPTHSLLFAGLVGAAFGGAGYLLGDTTVVGQLFVEELAWAGQAVRLQIAAFGFAVGVLAVLTHLLGDVLTPMGVNFLWPFSRKAYSLYLTRADNTLWNYGLLVVGVFATTAALYLASALVLA